MPLSSRAIQSRHIPDLPGLRPSIHAEAVERSVGATLRTFWFAVRGGSRLTTTSETRPCLSVGCFSLDGLPTLALHYYDVQRGVHSIFIFLSKSLQVSKCILAWLDMGGTKDIFNGSAI